MMRYCYTAILALLFLAGSLMAQPNRCTKRTVVGTYAVAAEGMTFMTLEDGTQMPVPIASLTVATIYPGGEVSSSGYVAVGDQIMRFGIEPGDPVMSSEITVNPNCTGIENLNSGQIGELIIQNNGDEISSIMIQGGPLGSPIITGRWKRISRAPDGHCPRVNWSHSVGGTYVARSSGISIIPGVGAAPDALLSRVSIGYDGTMEAIGTAMPAGTQMPFTIANGAWEEGGLPYTLTFSGTMMAGGMQAMGDVYYWGVALDGGNELWSIALAVPIGNPVALMTAKRTSRRPTDFE